MKRLLPFLLTWISCGMAFINTESLYSVSDDELYEVSLSELMNLQNLFVSPSRLEISAQGVASSRHKNPLELFGHNRRFKPKLLVNRSREYASDFIFLDSINIFKNIVKREG